ncbi:hypothetical protein OQA88_221 [Cercophora sp. LCS_1]
MSTPSSYHTALEADTTGISSPIESTSDLPSSPRYRGAVQPPHTLKSHCQIHLEEELYLPALHILDSLLTAGTTIHQTKYGSTPARIASPAQLALISTLTVHPKYTSRTPEGARYSNHEIATRAIAYLRGVLNLTGPVNANFRTAFSFVSASSAALTRSGRDRDSRWRSSRVSTPSDDSASDSSDYLDGILANEQSVWRRGTDFWAVLGWAFKCAAMHPERWRHWKGWIEFMVDVLERDWDERVALDEGEEDGKMQLGSLLMGYLDDLRNERKHVLKEVLRALMAHTDDDPSDKAVYKEVWEKELVVGVRKTKRKREESVVDLENGKFGDYLDWDADDIGSSEEEDAREGSPIPRRATGKGGRKPKAKAPEVRVTDGMVDTVPLRQRIFRLLSAAADAFPDLVFDVVDLYDRFTDRVRRLPLPLLRAFIESHSTHLPTFVQVELLRRLADAFLPDKHPDPDVVDPESSGGLTMLMLKECYLPFAAGRVFADDNARLSLVLENMLWFISVHGGMAGGGEELRRAVEKGIKAREDKIRKRTTSKDAADKPAREMLARSTRSLRVFVTVVGSRG